jgi:hypothetical protein
MHPVDDRVAETQMLLFMRTCILPLAKQTRALILVSGANDCFLSAALAEVALAEQHRLGKDCPFAVVASVSEYELHYRASNASDTKSLAGQLARGSRTWSKRMPVVNEYLKSIYSDLTTALQRCDSTPAASRYIVFESIDEDEGGRITKNFAPKNNFEVTSVSRLFSLLLTTRN